MPVALARLRWRDGFRLSGCGHRGHCFPTRQSVCRRHRCKKQTSLTAGTIFHSTNLPLTTWFAAIHPMATAKNGISWVERRYNRRYQLQTMIPRFLHSAARTQPIPYPALIAA